MLEIKKYRKLFPVTQKFIYFNHASSGPLSAPAADAISRWTDNLKKGFYDWKEVEAMLEDTRKLAATLFNVLPEEIAFVRNTSHGILIALGSIPWKEGDNVILMEDAFPANIYPWEYNLPDVEKRYVKLEADEDFLHALVAVVDKHTRAISIDWVHYLTGVRINLRGISELCKRDGIFLIVDAIQGLGALEIDLKKIDVDFFTAAASKWMFGPEGIGLLYVSKRVMPRLKPCNIGWLSAAWNSFESLAPGPIKKTAACFEEGTRNLLGLVGFRENLRLLLEAKISRVEQRVINLAENIITGLLNQEFELLTPLKPQSGIVSFRHPKIDSQKLFDKLRNTGVKCSLRKGWVRLSPHFYNIIEEVDKVIKSLSYCH